MGKTILFSPVGGTDPISSTNLSDGSLLHICRFYKPDKVYLYMSKEILTLHRKDNRYFYCLEKLDERLGRKCRYEIIERPELENVQEFNYFYEEFRKLIAELMGSLGPDDTLLLNVSSGTPAMKSGLLVLKTLGEFSCKAIQVATPDRRMNEHVHKDYDVISLWDCNLDNEPGSENRCREVKCPTLSVIYQEGIIKNLVCKYDYQAAFEVAKTLPPDAAERYLPLLRMASRRLLLDFSGTDQVLAKDSRYQLPVRDSSVRKYFEYALTLEIKLRRGEYADFLRAITPLLLDLFERVFERQTGLKLKNFCVRRKDGDGWCWNQQKMAGTEVGAILTQNYYQFKYGDVYSSHLCLLIERLGADMNVKKTIKGLRAVEKGLRNHTAHQIISVTDETLKRETGYTGQQIMDMIRNTFVYAGMGIRQEYWDSYDVMNQLIIDVIG